VGSEQANFDLGIKYQTMNIGVLYRFSSKYRIGLTIKNIADFYESSSSPANTPENAGFSLPVYTTLGFSTQYKGSSCLGQCRAINYSSKLIYRPLP
jgi:hypothetical protein